MKYVLLMGLPASGKTTFFNIYRSFDKLKKNQIKRISDLGEVLSMKSITKANGIVDLGDEGIEIKDRSLLNVALKKIISELPILGKKYSLVFIEFSRPDYIKSICDFPKEILDNSIGIYVKCPYEMCFYRNETRKGKSNEDGLYDYVPSQVMKKYYRTDDIDDLVKSSKFPIFIVNNSYEKLEDFKNEIEKLIQHLKM